MNTRLSISRHQALTARLLLFVLFVTGGPVGPGLPMAAFAQSSPPPPPIDFGVEATVTTDVVDEGAVRGRVFDASTGEPLERVTVLLKWPAPPGTDGRQEVAITDVEGEFSFEGVPSGTYDVSFVKSGYRNATMTEFRVLPEQVNRADFPLPPLANAEGDEVILLDEFVVEAETAAELVTSLETRLESDQLLNILSAEDFSKFAAGDVAEALERVAGINIVEGQFAIIRGLEDRYSSTLYNGAIVPSPDPDRQSVQLDLFPSEVVGSLNVTKAFTPDQPSNTAGGGIDILTHTYPEDAFEFKISAGTGYNERAKHLFIRTDGLNNVDKVVRARTLSTAPLRESFLTGDPVMFPDPPLQILEGNPAGRLSRRSGSGNWWDELDHILESDYTASIGGTQEHGDREFRFKGVLARERDFSTFEGFQGPRSGRRAQNVDAVLGPFDFSCFCFPVLEPERVFASSDLAIGELNVFQGDRDVTQSNFEDRTTAFGAFGFDLDDEGNHKVDASVLWTRKEEDTIRFDENFRIPTFDYPDLLQRQLAGNLPLNLDVNTPGQPAVVTSGSFPGTILRQDASDGPSTGAFVGSAFFSNQLFQNIRELQIYQINGDHRWEELPGLHFSWATNWARTKQDDVAFGASYWFEPCGLFEPCPDGITAAPLPTRFPPSLEELGPGAFYSTTNIRLSANTVRERSRFSRLDVDYEIDFTDDSTFQVAAGMWYERAERDVESFFLQTAGFGTTEGCAGGPQPLCSGATPNELFDNIAEGLDFTGGRETSSFAERDIDAWYVKGKLTLWDQIDFFGGVRKEKIQIRSINDPFQFDPVTGDPEFRLGVQTIFPSRFLFFDRFDNPFIGREQAPRPIVAIPNDLLLNLATVPERPCIGDTGAFGDILCVDVVDAAELATLLNGEINTTKYLPSLSFNFRPIEGLSIRGSWSKTIARPSFRELGYYATVEPGSNDVTVGNPQLQLSPVESYDARIEYTWGNLGDLLAVSWFTKDVENPVESIIISDPSFSGVVFRTFFNNPNDASLEGWEFEFRKSFDFFGPSAPEWLQYLSVGGNFTYVDAEVARTEAELLRAALFFVNDNPDLGIIFGGDDERPADIQRFSELAGTRRLFNQPEWIANADITFDHPDWGTKITVAYFRISDLLDAAGSVEFIGQVPISFIPDRYDDEFHTLTATISQTFTLPGEFGTITFKASGKNLTDSIRRRIYDPEQTFGEIIEREFKRGRDYSVSISYTRTF